MIVALIALFLSIGGIGYAAATIGSSDIKKNAVKSRHIKNEQVKKKDIHGGAVTSFHVDNDSLTGEDINESQLGKVPSAKNADTADKANAAFSTFHDAGLDFPNSLGTIATLNIPAAGSYVINAKFWALNVSATNNTTSRCTLTAGGDVDNQQFDASGNPLGDTTPVPMQLVHTFAAPGSVLLACTDSGIGQVEAHDTKITAVQVADLTNTPF